MYRPSIQPNLATNSLIPQQVSPESLKAAVTTALISLLQPIQAEYKASKEWQDVEKLAYPPPPKKEKKEKDKGSRHPGATSSRTAPQGSVGPQEEAAKVEALPDGSLQGEGREKVSVGTGVEDAIRGLDMKESPA